MRTWFCPQDGCGQVQFSVLSHGDWYSNVHGMTIDGHSISGPTHLWRFPPLFYFQTSWRFSPTYSSVIFYFLFIWCFVYLCQSIFLIHILRHSLLLLLASETIYIDINNTLTTWIELEGVSKPKKNWMKLWKILETWGSARLSKVRSRSGPAPFCGPRTRTSGPGPAILGRGPGHEYCGVMINNFFIFY